MPIQPTWRRDWWRSKTATTTWSPRASLGFTCNWYKTMKSGSWNRGQTVLGGFDEYETFADILQDNDHRDTMNIVLGNSTQRKHIKNY